jgi:hypothetical protein
VVGVAGADAIPSSHRRIRQDAVRAHLPDDPRDVAPELERDGDRAVPVSVEEDQVLDADSGGRRPLLRFA